jgi:hypothetical protein
MMYMELNRTWVALAAVTTLSLGERPAAAAPPPNDAIASATAIDGLPFRASLDTTGATSESDDPVYAGRGSTVWYSFTPRESARVVIDTAGSDYDTMLFVFKGSPGALRQVAWDDDGVSENGQSRLLLKAQAGVTYHVMVGAFADSAPGRLVLSARVGPPPLTLSLRFDPAAALDPRTGAATVRGKVTCSERVVVGVVGDVSQGAGASGSLFTYVLCDGEAPFTAEVTSGTDARFSRGSAQVRAAAMGTSDATGEAADSPASADLTLGGR